jgi:hypothetical protein
MINNKLPQQEKRRKENRIKRKSKAKTYPLSPRTITLSDALLD